MKQELEDLIEAVEAAINAGDWKVDGACDPTLVLIRAKKAIEQAREPVALQVNGIPLFKNPPNDVIDAAFHVSDWAQRNNWTKWRIGHCCSEDYTTPPQRHPLSDEQVRKALYTTNHSDLMGVVRAIEQAHGIKGDL